MLRSHLVDFEFLPSLPLEFYLIINFIQVFDKKYNMYCQRRSLKQINLYEIACLDLSQETRIAS